MKRTIIAALLCATSLAGCASAPTYSAPPANLAALRGPSPTVSANPMQGGLTCLREQIDLAPRPVRIAVSTIKDETGKVSYEAAQGGTAVTQGATLMVMSALGALGPNVRQVIRHDTRIAEWELSAAQSGLLTNGANPLEPRGQFEGSEYFIAGSVTEVNWNWDSSGAELEIGGIGAKTRSYAMDVTVDLYMARTDDLTMVGEPVTVRKQLVGQVSEAGVFSFLGSNYLTDFRTGRNRTEPVQYGLRAALQLAVLELAPRAFGTDFDRCREYANTTFAY